MGYRFSVAALLVAVAAATAVAQDADEGKKVYAKCKACHLIDASGKHTIGPNLHGVFGRKAAALENYKYSPAMEKSGLTWDEKSLTEYLKDPKAVVPGGKMVFPGLKAEKELADVISYLKEAAK